MSKLIHMALLAGLLTIGAALAQGKPQSAQRSTQDGVYSSEQSAGGRLIYQQNCAACHGADLAGVENAPGFVGGDFAKRWAGRPLSELHDYIMSRMPPGRAGAVGDQGTSDVIAYILARNSLPAGPAALSASRNLLDKITLAVTSDASAPVPAPIPAGSARKVDTASSGETATISAIRDFVPLTDAALRNPDPSDWVMMRGNYEGYGHSPLTQITKANVDKLQLVWARAMEPGINESTPLVYKGMMYLGNSGDVIQAIDAATGTLVWQYRRKLPSLETLKNLWGQRKRSIALYGDKIYFVSWDNFVVALDARTGRLAWQTDRGGNYDVTNSNGPIVVAGVVVAGSNCQRAAHGCYVTGHDATTGKELWRNEFIPRPGEPGDETWKLPFEKRWMTGAWGAITYDPQSNLVYYGSSGAGPAAEGQRGNIGATMAGTNTRFAVDPKTGKIAWRHQVLPRDNWDSECTFEMMPITVAVRPDAKAEGMMAVGKSARGNRRTLTGVPCKTGLVWSFDAKTGDFLWAKQTSTQNLVAGIDSKGLVTVREDQTMQDIAKSWVHCPSHFGGRDWPFTAYSPRSKLLFVMLQNTCSETTVYKDRPPVPVNQYNVREHYVFPEGKTKVGRIDAISVETGRTLWSWENTVSNYSPALSTESGLLFNGDMDRYLRAFDQDTGKVLWQTRLGSQAMGATVSFAINGRQYIAIAAGGGYNAGGLGMTPAADALSGNNMVYVFALPEGIN